MESSHFLAVSSPWPLYKMLFFDFWFRPPDAQNLLSKICTKSPIKSACMEDRPEMFGLPGGFRWWPIQWNHAKCCGADPCCHGNEIWDRRGDPVAYRLVIVNSHHVVHSILSIDWTRLYVYRHNYSNVAAWRSKIANIAIPRPVSSHLTPSLKVNPFEFRGELDWQKLADDDGKRRVRTNIAMVTQIM